MSFEYIPSSSICGSSLEQANSQRPRKLEPLVVIYNAAWLATALRMCLIDADLDEPILARFFITEAVCDPRNFPDNGFRARPLHNTNQQQFGKI